MTKSLRYTKGAGNAAIYLRIKNAGQYWNFSTLAWVAAEATATKAFLTEYADAGDAVESDFEVSFTPPPGGPWKIEIVVVATGATIAVGDTEASAPTGAHVVTVQFYRTATTTPIPDVMFDVYDSTETARANGTQLKAAINGQGTFNRDNGTYKIRAMLAGFNFTTGTVVVAGGNVTLIMYGAAITIPNPPVAGTQTLFGNVRELDWGVSTGDTVTAVIADKGQVVNGALIQYLNLSTTVDVNSQFFLTVPKDAVIRLTVPDHGTHEITINQENTYDVATYLTE